MEPGRGAAGWVAEQREILLAASSGIVADLDATGPAADPPAGPGRADAALSVLHLARLDDPARELGRARRLLGCRGRLLVLEPNRRPGWRGALADLAAPLVRLACGLRIDLPIPALVRAAGFTIISVERITMPTLVVPLRSFVRLVAVPSDWVPAGPLPGGGGR